MHTLSDLYIHGQLLQNNEKLHDFPLKCSMEGEHEGEGEEEGEGGESGGTRCSVQGSVIPVSCRVRERLLSSLFGTSLVHSDQPSSSSVPLAPVTRLERGEEVERVMFDLLPSGRRTHTDTAEHEHMITRPAAGDACYQ